MTIMLMTITKNTTKNNLRLKKPATSGVKSSPIESPISLLNDSSSLLKCLYICAKIVNVIFMSVSHVFLSFLLISSSQLRCPLGDDLIENKTVKSKNGVLYSNQGNFNEVCVPMLPDGTFFSLLFY